MVSRLEDVLMFAAGSSALVMVVSSMVSGVPEGTEYLTVSETAGAATIGFSIAYVGKKVVDFYKSTKVPYYPFGPN